MKTRFRLLALALAASPALAGLPNNGPAPTTPPPAVAPTPAPTSPLSDDLVFRALRDELARAKSLHMNRAEKPYYLTAVCTEEEGFQVAASFGSLQNRGTGKRSVLSVAVRVGSPALDNTNFADASDFSSFMKGGGGAGRASPAEPDYDAFRHALWLQFDDAYKGAVETLAKKRAYLQSNQVHDRPADFTPAQTVSFVEPRQALKVDQNRWTALVKRASAVFRDHPLIATSSVTFGARVNHQTFVSSDPAQHRFAEPLSQLSISAETQAPDGMALKIERNLMGRTEADLPTDDDILKLARATADRLDAMANSKVASEDYTGPVLFTGRAAALFMLQTLGEPLSHPRDDLGDGRAGRLVDRLGKHVTARGITVRDDPGLKQWHDQPLLGYYPVDDECVKPQPLVLVDDGVLKTYFMSRVPTGRINQSNGHLRGDSASASNLFVESKTPMTRAALKQKLMDLAKEEDLEYGLLVDDLDEGGAHHFSGGGEGSAGVSLPAPTGVFRIYPDGHEELVRGIVFKPATFRVLKDIVGLGNDATATNLVHRGQHVAVVTPSVLVKTLEMTKVREENERPPLTPRPLLSKQP